MLNERNVSDRKRSCSSNWQSSCFPLRRSEFLPGASAAQEDLLAVNSNITSLMLLNRNNNRMYERVNVVWGNETRES